MVVTTEKSMRQPDPPKLATIRGDLKNPGVRKINVRSGPSIDQDVIFRADVGTTNLPVLDVKTESPRTRLGVTSEESEWYLLQFSDGIRGWVRGDFLEINNTSNLQWAIPSFQTLRFSPGFEPQHPTTSRDQIRLTGITQLTPKNLIQMVAPYLQALSEIQSSISQLKDEHFVEPIIYEMRSGSADVSLDGLGDALKAGNDILSFPKRKQEYALREIQNKIAELTRQEALLRQNLLTKQVFLENDPQLIEAERRKQIATVEEEHKQKLLQTEEKILALRRDEWELEKEQTTFYFDIATKLVNSIMPQASEEKKLQTVFQLIPQIQVIRTSGLDLNIPPKPNTLPESGG